jgi:hypothetical protein
VSLAEKLIKDFEELPEIQKRLENMMDEVILENAEALEELAK